MISRLYSASDLESLYIVAYVIAAQSALHIRSRLVAPPEGICPHCKYDLAGLGDNPLCPECGRHPSSLGRRRVQVRFDLRGFARAAAVSLLAWIIAMSPPLIWVCFYKVAGYPLVQKGYYNFRPFRFTEYAGFLELLLVRLLVMPLLNRAPRLVAAGGSALLLIVLGGLVVIALWLRWISGSIHWT